MEDRRAVVVVAGDEADGEGREAGEVLVAGVVVEANGPDPGAAPPDPERGQEDDVLDSTANDEAIVEHVYGFGAAAGVLQSFDDQRPVDFFLVSRTGEVRSFRRFVDLLGQREGVRAVRRIKLMVDWRQLRVQDVKRLFRDVLRGHLTLESIDTYIDRLPARYLKFLTESIPSENGHCLLSELRFEISDGGLIDQEAFQAILEMVNRNAALDTLRLDFQLDANQSRLICQAVAGNNNLRSVSLSGPQIFADTLDGLATSSLTNLEVYGTFSDDAVPSLARQLRSNRTLERLMLFSTGTVTRDFEGVLLELVKSYNYTLVTFYSNMGSIPDDHELGAEFRKYTSRNERVRDALEELENPDPDLRVVVSNRYLPNLLGLVSDLPTVLYRVLKMGYLDDVSELLSAQVDDNQRVRRRRRRRRHDD